MSDAKIPLIVDLDQTLISQDLFFRSAIGTLKHHPMLILRFPVWFLQGKAYMKNQLVRYFDIDPKNLPYNDFVLEFIRQNQTKYSQIILATASHKHYAFKIAKYFESAKKGFYFTDVMASNQDFNLSGVKKAASLIARFGAGNFDYIGDHNRDLPVWEVANMAIIVNPSKRLIYKTCHLNRLILSN